MPHIWKRFWSLKTYEEFYLGNRRMTKAQYGGWTYFFGFRSMAFELGGSLPIVYERVWPWTRVRTTPLSELEKIIEKDSERLLQTMRGVTESVPSSWVGLLDRAPFSADIGWDIGRGYPSEQSDAHFDRVTPTQPNSDNNVTGPTS